MNMEFIVLPNKANVLQVMKFPQK